MKKWYVTMVYQTVECFIKQTEESLHKISYTIAMAIFVILA
jgi:hypothetical protein